MAQIACAECETLFHGERSTRRFCSTQCSRARRDRDNRQELNAKQRQYNAAHRETIRKQRAARHEKKMASKPPLPVLQCENCGKDFSQRDSRQKCCSKKCGVARYSISDEGKATRLAYARKTAPQRNALNREKYRTDKRPLEWARKWRVENPDRAREISEKARQKPEAREKARQISKGWHSKNRDSANQRRAHRLAQTLKITPWHVAMMGARLRSRDQKLPFDLTNDWARKRWTGRCELTGLEFRRGTMTVKFWSASIDKIVPSLGYVQGNCRFVLNCVNTFKNNLTDADMYFVAKALLATRMENNLDMPLSLPR